MRFAPHPVTLRQLQYAVAIDEHKSFRKAAAACSVSQPSLSAQLAQLEGALSLKLFERDTSFVRPTAAGVEFLAKARALLQSADDLVDEAQRATDPLAGPLRLGVIPTIGPYLLPEVALPLRQAFPRLRFTWIEERTAGLAAQLKSGQLDGAIVALETDQLGDVQSLVLGKDPFLLATAKDHPLARANTPVSPSVLSHEHVLVLSEGHCLGDQVAEVCARARAGDLDVGGTSLTTLSQMVVGGAGVTLLPALARGVENRFNGLHLRPFAPKSPARTLALVWRKGSPAVEALRAVAGVLKKNIAAMEPASK